MIVLNVLEWDLSAVTPYSILDHLLRSINLDSSFSLETVRKHAETFCALAATEHIFCQKRPAVVAVACLGAALRGLNSTGLEKMLHSLQISSGVQLVIILSFFTLLSKITTSHSKNLALFVIQLLFEKLYY
jgi:hypothetical protein